jgi:ubiquinone/menaquinone biosynthesis C-methylase UbiE
LLKLDELNFKNSLILIASSGYFLRNIGDNNKILEEIFSFLIRLIING